MNRYLLRLERILEDQPDEPPLAVMRRVLGRFRKATFPRTVESQQILDWLVEQSFDHHYETRRVEAWDTIDGVAAVCLADVITINLSNDDEAMFLKMRFNREPVVKNFKFDDFSRRNYNYNGKWWL